MQNTDIMELIDNTQIDSILIGFRKFVPYKKHFLEEVTLTNGSFFIDWLLNEKYIGKIGAMGLVTNAQVHVINTGYLYARMPEETFDVNTYSVENQNEYSFYWKNRFITFKNKKKLLKLVPISYKERIRIFLNEKKLQLRTVDEVSQLINYLYSLQ